MCDVDEKHLNLFGFFGFPDRKMRDEALKICDIDKLCLLQIEDIDLRFFDTFLERYSVWCYHINNFRSHLWTHFLLMYYQYFQNPFDTIDISKFQSPEGAHKTYFDTFAEDVALYTVSYFDKHLEMFNDLYNLSNEKGKRYKIIKEMKKVKALKALAYEYQHIVQSDAFREILNMRNYFVHNKSLSYYGMEVTKVKPGIYASGNSDGISTELVYKSVCELLRSYEHLCQHVNTFINARVEASKR